MLASYGLINIYNLPSHDTQNFKSESARQVEKIFSQIKKNQLSLYAKKYLELYSKNLGIKGNAVLYAKQYLGAKRKDDILTSFKNCFEFVDDCWEVRDYLDICKKMYRSDVFIKAVENYC